MGRAVGVAHDRHEPDSLAFGELEDDAGVEGLPFVVEHDRRADVQATERRPLRRGVHQRRCGEPSFGLALHRGT